MRPESTSRYGFPADFLKVTWSTFATFADTMVTTLRDHLLLMRPHQYVKNVLIFFPGFFGRQIGLEGTDSLFLLGRTFLAFLGFCLIASTVYILNDYIDREDDRKHPSKRNRPLASGAVSPRGAFIQMALLLLLGAALFLLADPQALLLGGLYLLLNIAYTFRLKHIPILDLVIIASGFVLRLFVGASVGDIELSMWIILMAFLLALFLGPGQKTG
jgi:decaprenyl-phosphate phosphoribosyltransferase